MRPLQLTLRAFGSYAGELTVDFARLGRHGIFAITGPTGAGKSTIFDALVYALYDGLPGFRETGHIRSQFAPAATPTLVRLDFEVHGRRWRIERTPTQVVEGRRSAVERKSTVLLEQLDADGASSPGSALTRKPEVKAAVEELVGLSKEQFEQVVLIPQGKFEEVLKADTAQRAPLLRRLFPVELYGRVTDALKAIADRRQADYDDAARAQAAIAQRLRQACVGVFEQVPDALRDAAPDGVSFALRDGGFAIEDLGVYLDDVLGVRVALGRLVDEAVSGSEAARRALESAREVRRRWDRWHEDRTLAASFGAEEAADAREEAALATARRIVDLRGVLDAWAEASARLAAAEERCRDRCAALRSSWTGDFGGSHLAREPSSSEVLTLSRRVASEAERLRAEEERFDRLARAASSLEERSRALDARGAALGAGVAELDAEASQLAELAEEITALEARGAGAERAASSVDELVAELALASRREELEGAAAASAAVLRDAEAAAAEAREHLARVRASWRDGLAGRLAQLLVDGEACPTCGALDHPAPAVPLEGAPDDAVLADAERVLATADSSWREAQLRAAQLAERLAAAPPARGAEVVGPELSAARADLDAARRARERALTRTSEYERRAQALGCDRAVADAERRELELEAAALGAERSLHEREREDYVELHAAFSSPAAAARAHASLAERLQSLAVALTEREDALLSRSTCADALRPVLDELGLGDPGELSKLALAPSLITERSGALDARRSLRDRVRARIAEDEAAGVPAERPDLAPLEAELAGAETRQRELVGRQAVISRWARELADGPDLVASAAKELDGTRKGLEHARAVAALCAGTAAANLASTSAGGDDGVARGRGVRGRSAVAPAVRLSLENWVLADYLRQVLFQANVRLAAMTAGRYALQLHEGVTDGRKPWGLDIAAVDAHTGQVRPATTLSGGETFMAALALALGLADVVSGGSNRRLGALFIDEGFGSLDPQALDGVVDVLRGLEDGGRIVGVISHVDEVKQALPTGITVEPTAGGSQAEVHYPGD